MAKCQMCDRDEELWICQKCKGKLPRFAFCNKCSEKHIAKHKHLNY